MAEDGMTILKDAIGKGGGQRTRAFDPDANSFRRDQGAATAASSLPATSPVVGVLQARRARQGGPRRPSMSTSTIRDQRRQLEDILETSPSLREYFRQQVGARYLSGRSCWVRGGCPWIPAIAMR
jgi:hypothetical protein